MSTDVARSFIATLHHDQCPINVLGVMTTGTVILASPHQSPAYAVDGTRTLGALDGTGEDWQLGQDQGLITFDKGPQPEPLQLYFRYSQAGYRLYLRSGAHFGQGVFCTVHGLVDAQVIDAQDPTFWHITDGQSGQPFDVTQAEGDSQEIQMTSSHGYAVEVHSLYPVGGHLACYADAANSTLQLSIVARNVDWLISD